MPRGSGHLLRLGATALAAALIAAAAWTYTGQSGSSGGYSAQVSQGLGRFSIPGLSAKTARAHRDKPGSEATHRRPTPDAARPGAAKPASMLTTAGPVPAPRPVSMDTVSTDAVDAPGRSPGGGEPSAPRPAPTQPRPAPRQPRPGPRQPQPSPPRPKPAPHNGGPSGGAPANPPSDPVATPPDPVPTPTPAPSADPAGDTDPSLDDTPVGGLDPGDLGGPIDETPDAAAPGTAAAAA